LLRGFSAYPTRALIGKGERLGCWAGAKRRPRCEGMTVQRGHRNHHTTHTRSGPRLHVTSSTTRAKKARTPRRVTPARWRSALLFGTFDVSEVGLLSGIPPQEHAEVPSTEPRGPYLYVRASAARACGVWHQILSRLLAGAHVLQALARHRPLVCFKLL
jgi:hypothetical protein